MADIDTTLGEQIRDRLAKEFGEVNTADFVLNNQQMVWWARKYETEVQSFFLDSFLGPYSLILNPLSHKMRQ